MKMNWYEIDINLPLSLLEPTYNFIWPYVNGLVVEKTDKNFMMRAFLFSLNPHQLVKKLRNFLRTQARSYHVEYPTPVVGPVISPFTDRFIIVPAPTSYIPPFGLPIFLQRGRAFGLGCHPCTIYCLEALKYIYTREPDTVRLGKILDAGIGTGILSIAAAKLGAKYIKGVDINDESIKEAQENIRFNNITRRIHIFHCSVMIIKEQFDIIFANLYGYFLAVNALSLIHLLSSKGWLILGGMAVPHDEVVISTFTNYGLIECARFRDEERSASILQKP